MDARSYMSDSQNYGEAQLNWIIGELKEANDNKRIAGVFLIHSWSWKASREWIRINQKTKRVDENFLANSVEKIKSMKK